MVILIRVILEEVRRLQVGAMLNSVESISPLKPELVSQMLYSKNVLSGHSKIDKTNILKTNGSLMKVESIAECSMEHSAILLTCIK